MLTESATLKIRTDDAERDIRITPLFLQNHKEPWEPNEIFDLEETGNNAEGEFVEFDEPLELGKIIVDDHKQWHFEGDGDMDESLLKQIADIVLDHKDEQ